MCGLLAFFDKHSGAIQALAAIVVAGLTLWLIITTVRYVRITESALNLSRQQFTETMRVEVFLKLRTIAQTSTALVPHIDFANLSGRGVWWEKYSVTVKVGENLSKGLTERLVQRVVPAYGVVNEEPAAAFYEAYRTTGLTPEKPIARVNIQATYRVGGTWQTVQLEIPEIILLGPKFVFLITQHAPPDEI